MSLFLKIFLWFWLALALMAAAVFGVTWTIIRDPQNPGWRRGLIENINIHASTAKLIYEGQGPEGVKLFFETIKTSRFVKEPCLWGEKEKIECSEAFFSPEAQAAILPAFSDENVDINTTGYEEGFAAKKFTTTKGETFVFAARLSHPPSPIPPFWFDWKTRLLRILAVVLTAGLGCYALARYLTRPIIKLSKAAKNFAGGDLQTRIASKRRDEIGNLERDFDLMAERIEELLISQKVLNRDISHELRSPLARLNVALELAKQKSSPASEAALKRIEIESQRINEMISDILTLSKLESKSEDILMSDINLSKLLRNIAEDADFEARGKAKRVEAGEIAECRIIGNERLLRSAIENVVRNGLRYAETALDISLHKREGKAIIIIGDDGPGIPEDELEKIFSPFYRVDQSRERRSGGIGLGLAIAKEALAAHQGEIKARNTGQGLTAEIMLPGAH